MQENNSVIPIKTKISDNAWVNKQKYTEMYDQSLKNPETFWDKQTEIIDWYKKYTKVKDTSFHEDLHINWFVEGKLNICYNAIDRHLAKKAGQTAIIWEGDEPNNSKHITYQELYENVCKLANGLKSIGVKQGDRVIIYMPMIPQAAYAMLACARIGAIHSVVFAGFAPETLKDRIDDCKAKYLITADEGLRGGKKVPLKHNIDEALTKYLTSIEKVIVYNNTNTQIAWYPDRDIKYNDLIANQPTECEPAIMDANDPLFILYTSGSTGKPKGVQHNIGGYSVYAATTFKYIFDYHDGDIYWSSADIGWITGHSYLIYGPLLNGATTLMFEGIPSYPTFSRFWDIIDKHKVNIFYTAPTALRALLREDESHITKSSRSSLRILGSVGEPINPEVWLWYHDVIGKGECTIVDTWWQTETGGILITPLPGATDLKPGSATLPFFGVNPVIVDQNGNTLEGECEGYLCLKDSWPGQMVTVYGNHKRFYDTYFSQYKGLYFSSDGAKRDKDGYYWITGRVDDVINVSGHRIGTAEVESAIILHHAVAEAAVVGCPHPIKGQGIYAFVTAKAGITTDDNLKAEIIKLVRKQIGAIATIDLIQWASGLPKTRSGKIMRRILRKIAENDYSNLGDINTLTNPEVVDELIKGRLEVKD